MALKTLDTIGNCQRLVFTVGVSQHYVIEVVTPKVWALDNTVYRKCQMDLKTLDTIDNCQRLVSTLRVK